jgi:hypothetical protein
MLDSSVVRAHQHAAGRKRGSRRRSARAKPRGLLHEDPRPYGRTRQSAGDCSAPWTGRRLSASRAFAGTGRCGRTGSFNLRDGDLRSRDS